MLNLGIRGIKMQPIKKVFNEVLMMTASSFITLAVMAALVMSVVIMFVVTMFIVKL